MHILLRLWRCWKLGYGPLLRRLSVVREERGCIYQSPWERVPRSNRGWQVNAPTWQAPLHEPLSFHSWQTRAALAVLGGLLVLLLPWKVILTVPFLFGMAIGTDTLPVGGTPNFTDVTGSYSRTFFSGSTKYTGTREQRITACNADAAAFAAANPGPVNNLVPASMLPYNANLVTYNTTVRMTREGGNPSAFDVQAYGAAGNNSADERFAIQAAINGANAAGGGIVFVPTGVYLVSAGPSFSFTNLGIGTHTYALGIPGAANDAGPFIQFKGVNRAASVIKQSTIGGQTADYALFLTTTDSTSRAAWVTFEDLTLDGAQTAANTPFTSGDEHLLYLGSPTHFTMNRCAIVNKRGGGMYLFKGWYGKITNSHFELTCWNSVNNAISLLGGLGGFAGSTMGGHIVAGCTFKNNGQIGVSVGGFSGSGEQDAFNLDNCTFVMDTSVFPGQLGFEMVNAGGSDVVKRANITNCAFEGSSGVVLQGTDTNISNCTFRNMNRGGGQGRAIYFNNAPGTFRCSISNCSVDTCTNEGMFIDGTRTQVTSCSVTGASVGIFINSTATGTQLTGNTLVGNTTPITDNGTGTVRTDNNLTTGAMQGRTVLVAGTVTVTTAEAQANDNIVVSRVVAGGALGQLSIGTITAGTSFVINSSSGTETSTLFWKIVH